MFATIAALWVVLLLAPLAVLAVRFRIGDGVGSPMRYRDKTARYWNAR